MLLIGVLGGISCVDFALALVAQPSARRMPLNAPRAALPEFPRIVLDDDGSEESASVIAFQEVGRQVAASLGFFLTSPPQIEPAR